MLVNIFEHHRLGFPYVYTKVLLSCCRRIKDIHWGKCFPAAFVANRPVTWRLAFTVCQHPRAGLDFDTLSTSVPFVFCRNRKVVMCFIHADDALFDVITTTSWRIKVNFREQLTIWIQNVQINRKTRSKQDNLCIIKPLLQVIISCPSKTSVISICNACCLQLLWTLLSVCPPH